jgi:hypothetical protein
MTETSPKAAYKSLKAHFDTDADFREAVRHNLDGMLFTEAKKHMTRRKKANVSVIDLEEIVKAVAPKIMRIFENH